MKVKRIVANIQCEEKDPTAADAFYRDILGLEIGMDLGWIRVYACHEAMTVQLSVAREKGDGMPMPDLSIDVDDIEEALKRVKAAGIPLEFGPTTESWGVRRFMVRDPFGKLLNILQQL